MGPRVESEIKERPRPPLPKKFLRFSVYLRSAASRLIFNEARHTKRLIITHSTKRSMWPPKKPENPVIIIIWRRG